MWKVDVPRRRETLVRGRERLPETSEGERNDLAQGLALAIHHFKAQGRDDREIRWALGTPVIELAKVEDGGAPGG